MINGKRFDCNFYTFRHRPESLDYEFVVWVHGNLPCNPHVLDDDDIVEDYCDFQDAVERYLESTGLEWGIVTFDGDFEV